jgi:hypothetical protein
MKSQTLAICAMSSFVFGTPREALFDPCEALETGMFSSEPAPDVPIPAVLKAKARMTTGRLRAHSTKFAAQWGRRRSVVALPDAKEISRYCCSSGEAFLYRQ